MAVPKKKTSPTKRGMRRAGQHHRLAPKTVLYDPGTGDYVLPHRISPSGTYRGERYFARRERRKKKDGDA